MTVSAVLILVLGVHFSVGNASGATISGIVTDNVKAGVPGARVTLMQNAITVAIPTNPLSTDGSGQYQFSGIGAGNYTVRADMAGHSYESTVVVDNVAGTYTCNIAIPGFIYQATPVPAPVDYVYVPGTAKDGVTFTAPATGVYRFTITDGAYYNGYTQPNTWWQTNLFIYKDRPVERQYRSDGDANFLANWDFEVGNPTPVADKSQAVQAGIGESVDIPLAAGQYIVLICEDARSSSDNYADNQGGITLRVAFLAPSPTPTLTPTPTALPTATPAPVNNSSASGHATASPSPTPVTAPGQQGGVSMADAALPVAAVVVGGVLGTTATLMGTAVAGTGTAGASGTFGAMAGSGASTTTETVAGTQGSLWAKLWDFLSRGLINYFQGWFSFLEKNFRKITAVEHIPLVMGISSQEIAVGVISAVILGAAFAYRKKLLFSAESIFLFVVVAGFTVVAHELAHRYTALRYKATMEYKFWGVGMAIMLITTILTNTPFAQPARTILNARDLDSRKSGIISYAGPVMSLLLALIFLGMVLYGGFLKDMGTIGFGVSALGCVYSLMPFEPMEGRRVYRWNKAVWAFTFVPALLVYLTVLILVL